MSVFKVSGKLHKLLTLSQLLSVSSDKEYFTQAENSILLSKLFVSSRHPQYLRSSLYVNFLSLMMV